ncbi:RNA-guided pseudouridylation complex pseudouridine synthase subunit Cbf5 [Candidatus Woesearchaeota archaeon]|nr:RNA-guided pseudouridylation complex pseudouridine synthase subunit Cbf5 [Candidatus Woesearchaeota archaeon]
MPLLPFEKIKRNVLVLCESKTDPKHGCFPENFSVETLLNYGVINLNKYKGPTSHQVSDIVKKVLNVQKAGHGGSLDPHVTGVLPIALGRATKVVEFILKAGKEYVCLMHLHKKVSKDIILTAFKGMIGEITQLPPRKSAVVRSWRKRNIYYTEILEINGQDVLLKIGCQAGTYIRKYIHDFGILIGIGAHMAELIRTKAGPFNYANWVTIQDLEDAYYFWKEEHNEKLIRNCIKPVEFAVSHLPKVWVFDSSVNTLCHGASLKIPGISKIHSGIQKQEIVAVMTLKDELIAVGIAQISSEQIMSEKKGVAIKTQKVFMQPGTYLKQQTSS